MRPHHQVYDPIAEGCPWDTRSRPRNDLTDPGPSPSVGLGSPGREPLGGGGGRSASHFTAPPAPEQAIFGGEGVFGASGRATGVFPRPGANPPPSSGNR